MCMEPLSAMTLFGFGTAKCYKATVNESETITDAKPANLPAPMTFRSSCEVRCGNGARAPESGYRRRALARPRFPFSGAGPCRTELELGSVRKRWTAVRPRAGDFARPQFPDPGPFLPVSHRTVRCRQDVAPETAVSVAAADARAGQPVRPGRLAAAQGRHCQPAQTDRNRAAGFSPARPHDHLRECRAAVPCHRQGGIELSQGGDRPAQVGGPGRTD